MIRIELPATGDEIAKLSVGDRVLMDGTIYTGRDAALPKLVKALKAG
ncbi:MAG: fumarate hydratase, partial [Methanothermobacter sp.]|nr:fumarate hydratase [Methanothermobacter sp.]